MVVTDAVVVVCMDVIIVESSVEFIEGVVIEGVVTSLVVGAFVVIGAVVVVGM